MASQDRGSGNGMQCLFIYPNVAGTVIKTSSNVTGQLRDIHSVCITEQRKLSREASHANSYIWLCYCNHLVVTGSKTNLFATNGVESVSFLRSKLLQD